MHWYCALKTHLTHGTIEDVKSVWYSFIHRFVLHMLIDLSMCQTCFQCMIFVCKMYEPMDKLRMSFIINLLHVKFVMPTPFLVPSYVFWPFGNQGQNDDKFCKCFKLLLFSKIVWLFLGLLVLFYCLTIFIFFLLMEVQMWHKHYGSCFVDLAFTFVCIAFKLKRSHQLVFLIYL
jgi:hypothetical protein